MYALDLNLRRNYLIYPKNIEYLCSGIKKLPNNLKSLTLDLSDNHFGDHIESVEKLADCMK